MQHRADDFCFHSENLEKAKNVISKYPAGKERSAILPLLHLAQLQNKNWISPAVVAYIAKLLSLREIEVEEIVSFYSMFNNQPVGKYLLQVCRTTICWLCNNKCIYDAVADVCKLRVGETSKNGLFTFVEVECLGACVNAPVLQINEKYYENLTYEKVVSLLRALEKGET